MLVNVRKMAAEGGGVWGAGGRLEEGQQENSDCGPALSWGGKRKCPGINMELGTDLQPPSRLPSISRPRCLRLRMVCAEAAITHAE